MINNWLSLWKNWGVLSVLISLTTIFIVYVLMFIFHSVHLSKVDKNKSKPEKIYNVHLDKNVSCFLSIWSFLLIVLYFFIILTISFREEVVMGVVIPLLINIYLWPMVHFLKKLILPGSFEKILKRSNKLKRDIEIIYPVEYIALVKKRLELLELLKANAELGCDESLVNIDFEDKLKKIDMALKVYLNKN